MERGKYGFAAQIRNRFRFTSYTGQMKLYSETGELLTARNGSMVFTDGIINISDNGETITVAAKTDSSAVFAFEIADKIIAAFSLSCDRGLLVKHLDEHGGRIPLQYKDSLVALFVLPNKPFRGSIRVKPMTGEQKEISGPITVNNREKPRMFVPEPILMMYQHIRNEEKSGKRPLTKHTFSYHENPQRFNDVGHFKRMFTATEAMIWLEKAKNRTEVEIALQREFTFGTKQKAIITFPKYLSEYVRVWCKNLGFVSRPPIDVDEEYDSDTTSISNSSGPSNSQDSDVDRTSKAEQTVRSGPTELQDNNFDGVTSIKSEPIVRKGPGGRIAANFSLRKPLDLINKTIK